MDFTGDSVLKNQPAKQKMQVHFLGQEDFLENEMATHSSIVRYFIDRGARWATVHRVTKESGMTWGLNNNLHVHIQVYVSVSMYTFPR